MLRWSDGAARAAFARGALTGLCPARERKRVDCGYGGNRFEPILASESSYDANQRCESRTVTGLEAAQSTNAHARAFSQLSSDTKI